MKKLSPSFLSYTDIKKTANDFLIKHHPIFTLPIPIEDIAELKLGINLSVIIGLKKCIDSDGYINSSCNEIFLDYDIFNKFEERTRFTIAHEIGHLALHKVIYCTAGFTTVEEFLAFQDLLTDTDHRWLEYQANAFAACVLVPEKLLQDEISKLYKEKKLNNKEEIIPYLIDLPSKFKVSPETLIYRMQKEQLI